MGTTHPISTARQQLCPSHASNIAGPLYSASPSVHMDSSLHEVWQAAAGSPFLPTIGKNTQFLVAFILLLIGISLTGVFALNRSLANVPLLGIPASLAIAYGTVYMFCAVGVYV